MINDIFNLIELSFTTTVLVNSNPSLSEALSLSRSTPTKSFQPNNESIKLS